MSFRRARKSGGNARKSLAREIVVELAVLFLVVATAVIPVGPAFAQAADTTAATTDSSITPTGSSSVTDNSTTLTSAPSGDTTQSSSSGGNDVSTASSALIPAGTAPSPSTSKSTAPTNPSSAAPGIKSPTPTSPSNGTASINNAQSSAGSGSPGQGSVSTDFFNAGQFKIDENTGAAKITYPIDISPGRNGLQPTVDLAYNSQNSQLGSIVGEGWSIDIPYIERMNIAGVDALYATDTPQRFFSSIDGELATTTISGSYIARTEKGSFNKYTFANNSWTMIAKDGTEYVFGSTPDSSQNDPNNASDTYKWMLKQVTDANGNTITYSYFKNSGQIYPASTTYTGNGSSTGIFEVDFALTTSTDNGVSYTTGFPVQSNYRVSQIVAKVNGTWVRKYTLGYTAGDNGSITLLGSIAESGENASGTVVSLPSSTFTYQTQTPGWVSNSTWIPTISFTATSSIDDGVRVADVNGDGLPDIIQGFYNGSATTSVAYINTGSGWVASSTWDPPVVFSNDGTDTGTRIVDVNGDGLPDIIQAYSDASGVQHYAAYINNGHGWTLDNAWDPPTLFVASGTINMGTRLADINGDRLPDIVQAYTDGSGTSHYATYLNTGNGWATSTAQWNSPVAFADNGVDTGARLVDVNGDGLADIIQAYTDSGGTNHYAAYLNNGSGWSSASAWNPPVSFTLNGTDNGTRFVDVNGDGLPDVIQAYKDGSGVEHTSAYTNNNRFRADLLTGIQYPQGGSSTIQYQSILQLTDPLGNVLNGVPYPVYIVSAVGQDDGFGNVATSTYVYYGGTYYTNGPFDHEFAGFTSVKATDPAGNVTVTYYDTSNGTNTALGQYDDNFWKIGKAYRVENYDNTGKLYRVTITKWDSTSLGGDAGYVFPDDTLEMDYDGLSTHKDSAESYAWNTADGNETQKIDWGQVTGAGTGAFTTSTNGYATDYTYASSAGSNVIGKVSGETLYNPAGTKIREAQYYYDNLGLGSVDQGNLTKEADWISGGSYATTQNTYNSYGLVTQTLDPRNNTTTYSYDVYNLYPATTTNALGQTTYNQYDYSTGKITQTIDPNHLTFATTYDGLGRPLQILQPDQVTTSTLDTKTSYVYIDTADAVSVRESDYLNATAAVDTYTYYDGLGRLIQTRQSATDAGIYKVTDQAYNNRGLVQSVSLPYFASGSAKAAPTTTAALFTTYTYDPLGRVLTTRNAVGNVTDSYDNWKTTITDADGHEKDEYHDGYGNLVEVAEHNGTSTYDTYYSYDGLHDLVNLTDANGDVRSFAYDGLGRMLTSTDLHTPTSSTYGTWQYTYDDAGNLVSRTDPKNQTVNWTYDALNRVLTESTSSVAIAYTYDTCTNGVGRLCTVSSTDAASLITKTYDPLGNLASETKTINGIAYTTSYTYDRQGNILTITNPDDSVVQYTYGNAGLTTSVQEKEPGGSFSTILSGIYYSPTDQIAIETYANGIVAKNIYDPLQLYRLTGKVTTDNQGQSMSLLGSSRLATPFLGGSRGLNASLTITEPYTGSVASFTVPIGVATLTISAYGAQGGGGGGLGGAATGTLSVTPNTTYHFAVGQEGGTGSNATSSGPYSGSGGGGMTWFSSHDSFDSSVLIVVGGGAGVGGDQDFYTGNAAPGGIGGFGGGGAGGSTNGSSPGAGGGGGGYYGGYGGAGQSGGAAGTQDSGYALGSGGPGGSSLSVPGALGGGGGSGGGLSGTAGAVSYDGNGFAGTGGGGGGSSFLANGLTATSTATGVNGGNGHLTITEYPAATVYAPSLSSQDQYFLNTTTTLGVGSSTTEGSVTLGAMLNSSGTLGLQLQVEVEPMGKNFTDIPNVTSTPFMAPNQLATTTFYGLNGSYHWQARVVDVFGNSSGWQRFSSSTYTTDFVIEAPVVSVTKTYTGAIDTYTVPIDVDKVTIAAYGAQGGNAGGSGGLGGKVSGTLQVVPGSTYYLNVGGQGGNNNGCAGGAGGFDGGGGGGSGIASCPEQGGGGGGGVTWFSSTSTFSTSTVLLVAAGGGGAMGAGGIGGGNGGGLVGATGAWQSNGSGGGGGTQTTGGAAGADAEVGSAGQGGYGGARGNDCEGQGGGGGGGYYGGGGGGDDDCNNQGSGGGGGSSYISNVFTNASTASGVNSGNGYLQITEYHYAPIITSLNQYHLDGVTPIGDGSSTIENGVAFGATLTSNGTSSIQLQAEVEPAGKSFTNVANISGSTFVTPGSYHWQARAVDAHGNASAWHIFNTATTTVSSGPVELYDTSFYDDPNLVSYYRFEGNLDEAKGNYNGTPHNITFGSGYGLFGQGGNFNGSNSYGSTGYNISYPITITVWEKTTSGGGAVVSWQNDAQTSGPWFSVDSGWSQNGPSFFREGWNATDLENGQWHFIAVTVDSSGHFQEYVDGVPDKSGTTTNGNAGQSGIIGSIATNQYFFNGDYDDLAIFSRVLSSAEIADLYNSGTVPAQSDFTLDNLYFAYPPYGTTTPQFSNWQMKAHVVTSTDSYQVQVNWGLAPNTNQVTSTINASGTQLLTGVNVPKTLFSGDYSDTGDPVPIAASGTLTDITGTSAVVSKTSVNFDEDTIPATGNCSSADIQCIAYTYDPNGNITKVVDSSASNAAITVNYTYDDLNRLIAASSSDAASGENYHYTYTYDAVGNILAGPYGNYTYAGTGYPNTDAVTRIVNGSSTVNFSYDNNGNVTSASGTAYTWNYRNELMTASSSNSTSTYGYDYTGQRMETINSASTNYYPEITYSVSGATSTKDIFVNNVLVATIVGTSASSTVYSNFTDSLGISNVSTGPTGTVSQVLSYYPYGAIRFNQRSGSFDQQRKYIGQIYDGQTGLVYDDARYYNGTQGQFLSEEPAFLDMGNPGQIKQLINQDQASLLADPQQLNPYSYGRDNPIVKEDPTGKYAISYSLLGFDFEGGVIDSLGFNFNLSLNFVHNPQTNQSWIAPTVSFGAAGILWPGGPSATYPKMQGKPTVFGASAGGNLLGYNLSVAPNVNSLNDLQGSSQNFQVNVPFVSVAAQNWNSSNPTYSGSFQTKAQCCGSVSNYPVQTWVPGSVNITGSPAANAINGAYNYFQSAINTIQAEITSIKQEIAKL